MVEAEAKAIGEKKSDADIAKAREKAKNPFDAADHPLTKAIDELAGHQAVAPAIWCGAWSCLRKAGSVEPEYLARLQFQGGEQDKAIEAARKHADEPQERSHAAGDTGRAALAGRQEGRGEEVAG